MLTFMSIAKADNAPLGVQLHMAYVLFSIVVDASVGSPGNAPWGRHENNAAPVIAGRTAGRTLPGWRAEELQTLAVHSTSSYVSSVPAGLGFTTFVIEQLSNQQSIKVGSEYPAGGVVLKMCISNVRLRVSTKTWIVLA